MEITQNLSQLPARPPVDGEFGPVPAISEIKVGDFVAIFSRGCERVAQVEKIGRTNLTCIYTTMGAWDEATKIYGIRSRKTYVKSHDHDSETDARTPPHWYRLCFGMEPMLRRRERTVGRGCYVPLVLIT